MNRQPKMIAGVVGAGLFGLALMGGSGRRECCGVRPAHADTARSVAGATQQVTLLVGGMHCATCPLTVRVTLEKLDGVKSAKVSAKDAKAVVEFDPTKVTPERMAKAVTDAGYPTQVATAPKGS